MRTLTIAQLGLGGWPLPDSSPCPGCFLAFSRDYESERTSCNRPKKPKRALQWHRQNTPELLESPLQRRERSMPLGFARGRCPRGRCPRRVRQHIATVPHCPELRHGGECRSSVLVPYNGLIMQCFCVYCVGHLSSDQVRRRRLTEGQSHGCCTNFAHTCGAWQPMYVLPIDFILDDRLPNGRPPVSMNRLFVSVLPTCTFLIVSTWSMTRPWSTASITTFATPSNAVLWCSTDIEYSEPFFVTFDSSRVAFTTAPGLCQFL